MSDDSSKKGKSNVLPFPTENNPQNTHNISTEQSTEEQGGEDELSARRGEFVLPKIYASLKDILRLPKLRKHLLGVEGELAYDRRALVPVFNSQPLEDADNAVSAIRERINRKFQYLTANGRLSQLEFSGNDVCEALLAVAKEKSFDPVEDALRSYVWDGVPRIKQLAYLLQDDPSPLTQTIMRKWMVAAVKRVVNPGEKVDNVLVLQGNQGLFKSSFFKELATPEWFCDSKIDIAHKDAYLIIHRAWIMEWSELEPVRRSNDDSVKAFVTSTTDTFRPPYARSVLAIDRCGVIVATTNRDEFLTDDTGHRRYWTVKVEKSIDLDWIRANRVQLWAEAFAAREEQHWLTPEEEDMLAEAQKEFEVVDPWEENIEAILVGLQSVAINYILDTLGVEKEHRKQSDRLRVHHVLVRLGWKQGSSHKKGRLWFPPGAKPSTRTPTPPQSGGQGRTVSKEDCPPKTSMISTAVDRGDRGTVFSGNDGKSDHSIDRLAKDCPSVPQENTALKSLTNLGDSPPSPDRPPTVPSTKGTQRQRPRYALPELPPQKKGD